MVYQIRALQPKAPAKPKPHVALHPQHAKFAADRLVSAFNWAYAAEGPEFWSDVHKRLLQISVDGIIKDAE